MEGSVPKGREEVFRVTDMFTVLTLVMVSQVGVHLRQNKYVLLSVCQS